MDRGGGKENGEGLGGEDRWETAVGMKNEQIQKRRKEKIGKRHEQALHERRNSETTFIPILTTNTTSQTHREQSTSSYRTQALVGGCATWCSYIGNE